MIIFSLLECNFAVKLARRGAEVSKGKFWLFGSLKPNLGFGEISSLGVSHAQALAL